MEQTDYTSVHLCCNIEVQITLPLPVCLRWRNRSGSAALLRSSVQRWTAHRRDSRRNSSPLHSGIRIWISGRLRRSTRSQAIRCFGFGTLALWWWRSFARYQSEGTVCGGLVLSWHCANHCRKVRQQMSENKALPYLIPPCLRCICMRERRKQKYSEIFVLAYCCCRSEWAWSEGGRQQS